MADAAQPVQSPRKRKAVAGGPGSTAGKKKARGAVRWQDLASSLLKKFIAIDPNDEIHACDADAITVYAKMRKDGDFKAGGRGVREIHRVVDPEIDILGIQRALEDDVYVDSLAGIDECARDIRVALNNVRVRYMCEHKVTSWTGKVYMRWKKMNLALEEWTAATHKKHALYNKAAVEKKGGKKKAITAESPEDSFASEMLRAKIKISAIRSRQATIGERVLIVRTELDKASESALLADKKLAAAKNEAKSAWARLDTVKTESKTLELHYKKASELISTYETVFAQNKTFYESLISQVEAEVDAELG